MKNERIKAIVTLVVAAVTVLNAVLTASGKNPIPFDENAFTAFLSQLIAAAGVFWAWWKNNNMTQAAKKGQDVINAEKSK